MDITLGRLERNPDRWFLKELKLIDPDLHCIWNNKWQRFLIVRKAPANVFREGYFIEALVHDGNNNYAPLDRRVLNRLKEAVWEREHILDSLEKFYRAQAQEEEKKAQYGVSQRRDALREFRKQIYRHRKTMTFV